MENREQLIEDAVFEYFKIERILLSDIQKDFNDWTIKNGVFFHPKDVDEDESSRLANIYNSQKRECYKNSVLIEELEEIPYFQGYYFFEDFFMATNHAWNVKDGKVIDVTASLLDIKPLCYFGIQVERKFIKSSDYFGGALISKFIKSKKDFLGFSLDFFVEISDATAFEIDEDYSLENE